MGDKNDHTRPPDMLRPSGDAGEDIGSVARDMDMRRIYTVKVRLNWIERAMFKVFCQKTGRDLASALRHSLKSEIRRHRNNVNEYADLLSVEERLLLDGLNKD